MKGDNDDLAIRDDFFSAFLDFFFPRELRKEKIKELREFETRKNDCKGLCLEISSVNLLDFMTYLILNTHLIFIPHYRITLAKL